MHDLLFAAAPALFVLVPPFLASTVAALGCAAVHAGLKRQPERAGPAGEWLEVRAAGAVPGVRVGVAPEIVGSMDGYWPDSRFIGLSPRTWADRSPAGRAVAAHELGHALAWAERPDAARIRGRLRQIQGHALAVLGASTLTAALLDSALAVGVALAALGVGLVGHLASLLDEADASRRAARVLEAEGERSLGTDLAMLAAGSVYLAPFLAHLGMLASFGWLSAWMLEPSRVAPVNDDLTLMGVLGLAPILVLRAMHVLSEVGRPTPILTELRLNWTMFLERSWEFHAGVIVLVWLALAWDEPVARGLAPLFLLGAIPAMGPLGGLGRLVVVLPIVLVLGATGALKEPPRVVRAPRPLDPMEVVRTDTPWSARAVGLMRVAWAPLLVVLVARAARGWATMP